MRTASAGGSVPSRRKRRTFDSDAVSTSIENVDSGACATCSSGLSARCSYSSTDAKSVDGTGDIGIDPEAVIDLARRDGLPPRGALPHPQTREAARDTRATADRGRRTRASMGYLSAARLRGTPL
jgi:hypothetical protein